MDDSPRAKLDGFPLHATIRIEAGNCFREQVFDDGSLIGWWGDEQGALHRAEDVGIGTPIESHGDRSMRHTAGSSTKHRADAQDHHEH